MNAHGHSLVADQVDPFLGWAYDTSRLQDVESRPGFVVYGADGDPGQPVLVTLGGSTTDHQYNPEHNWPRQLAGVLQRQGRPTAVYNGGVFGYRSDQELLKLLRDVLPLAPDVVVAFDGINDLSPLERPLVHPEVASAYNALMGRQSRYLPNTMTLLQGLLDSEDRLRLWAGVPARDPVAWHRLCARAAALPGRGRLSHDQV
jgi:hypothetical protein